MWRMTGKFEPGLAGAYRRGTALAFSPDERALASGSWDGTIKVWDLENGALRWMGQHSSSIQRLAFTPDGRTLASGGDDAAIRLWMPTRA